MAELEPGESSRRDSAVHQALAGAVYPLRRQEIVAIALENEAPARLVTLLSGLPDRAFGSLEDVDRWLRT